MRNQKGCLEVICGSMFSGKSEELIRRLRRSEIAKKNVVTFKHSLDDRKAIEFVVSHCGNKLKAYATAQISEIEKLVFDNTDIIGIDEVQFYDKSIVNLICKFLDAGKKVIVAGLDLDFRGVPFGVMPVLLAIADNVTKLKAICMECGKDAQFTQRLVDGKAAKFDDPIILVGAEECYQARCRGCFDIDKSPVLF